MSGSLVWDLGKSLVVCDGGGVGWVQAAQRKCPRKGVSWRMLGMSAGDEGPGRTLPQKEGGLGGWKRGTFGKGLIVHIDCRPGSLGTI